MLDGRDITRWPPHRRGRRGARPHVPAHPRVRAADGARERRGGGARRRRRAARGARERADELLERLGLAGYADAPPSRSPTATSGGSAWRARWRPSPRFVLLDEPAAGLPEAEVPAFAEVVRSVRDDHGAGVLLIDHNMALIMDVCDRIQVLDQGRTLAEGTPAEIRAQPRRGRRVPRRERRCRDGADRLVARGARGALRRRARRARPDARGRAGGGRRPDRAERRGQVEDAARGHGRRPGRRRRGAPRRHSRSSAAARGHRARGRGARARGPAHLRRADRRGEPPARPRRPARRGGAAEHSSAPRSSSRRARVPSGGRRARSRAASSSSSRSRARSSPSPTCCCSTSRRSASRRAIVDASSRRSRRSASAASPSCSPSSGPSARWRSPTARYVLANGAARLTLGPETRATPTALAAYLLTLASSRRWQTLADASRWAALYALMAVGIGLVFGVLRLVNFAYGQLVMAGAYALAFASQQAGRSGRSCSASWSSLRCRSEWTGSSSGRCAPSRRR